MHSCLLVALVCATHGRPSSPQEPDEDDEGDSDEEAGVDAATARAAGIDVRGGGAAVDGDAAGAGGGLNVQEMRRDAFWLQRRVSQAFSAMDADAAQALAEKVFVTLQVRWCLKPLNPKKFVRV